jgi:hypothetical protein
MKKFNVTVTVLASDIMEAEVMKQGVQNVLNEMGESYQPFIVEMADVEVARGYRARIESITNNKLFKSLAKAF